MPLAKTSAVAHHAMTNYRTVNRESTTQDKPKPRQQFPSYRIWGDMYIQNPKTGRAIRLPIGKNGFVDWSKVL